MSQARHHLEWLSLVPTSGPFLSLPVLLETFPQGLDAHDPDLARRLRMAYDEWDEDTEGKSSPTIIHRAWIEFVLKEILEWDGYIVSGQSIPQTMAAEIPEHGETLRPDYVLIDPSSKKPRLLIQTYFRTQKLNRPVPLLPWKVSPETRMAQLLQDTNVRVGIITNGEQWMLVSAKRNETTGFASWYSNLLVEEPITLRALRTLLGCHRLFGVAEDQTLESLLDKSASDQQEVTDQLGYQVRKAVEVLIQALDKADADQDRKLLAGVDEKELYEAALTVMMRLVFLFCAEERELLLLGDELWDQNYSVSTLREQLRQTADQHGEEILAFRHDAWARLITTFRVLFAGTQHDRLKIPAYGGRLFNPDRFPMLEGRKKGSHWRTDPAVPLPINNRTVLHLLEALQILQIRLPGGGQAEARKLSFRALDIEQIGHVYEGLLDHTAKRADKPYLGLSGTRNQEPEIPVDDLEAHFAQGEATFLDYLKEQTGRSTINPIKKALAQKLDETFLSRLGTVCQSKLLYDRVVPFAGLIRTDTQGYPIVITPGSVFVTEGTDRRSSGTHYTPKSLTEPIVQYTLEPLVYVGPAEGVPKEDWKLRSAGELLQLKICDMACGSGAFLVQACRYMAARLLEAWAIFQKDNPGILQITPEGRSSSGSVGEMLIPEDPEERLIFAQRLVAQRCLYGVDKNPLAVEMAKLSLWLLTLAKDKPFEFLDHAIRAGDSLVGIHNIEQLKHFSLKPNTGDAVLFKGPLDSAVDEAIGLRLKLEDLTANSVEDVERQELLLKEANEKIAQLRCAADLLVAAEFWGENLKDKKERVQHAAIMSGYHIEKGLTEKFHQVASTERRGQMIFHWPLEFPEVIVKQGGFDAFIGNPPFMGGKKITGGFGDPYRDFIVSAVAGNTKGHADLCAYFFLRASSLVRQNGAAGLIATNTIAQGDTREVGLDQVVHRGFILYRAISSTKWSGTANLEVGIVWFRNGKWSSEFTLDGHNVQGINAYLSEIRTISGNPYKLASNGEMSFQGSNILGMGFFMEPAEASLLLQADGRNKDAVFPCLSGDDFNSRPDQTPSRWVINFFSWPLQRSSEGGWASSDVEQRKEWLAKGIVPSDYSDPVAADYPTLLAKVQEKVKPTRDLVNRKPYRERWWRYAECCTNLYKRISTLPRVLFHGYTSKYLSFGFVPNGYVYAGPHVVVAISEWAPLACLLSTFHEAWVFDFGSTHETRLRYAPADCFETFPFPEDILEGESKFTNQLEEACENFCATRAKIMRSQQIGITATLNLFHDPNEMSSDIQKLRDLHFEMDQAVAAAYGWTDLELCHDFHETKQGVRFTISEDARREVLQRLLKLNHERYAEEVKQGLHDKKKGKAIKPKIQKEEDTSEAGEEDQDQKPKSKNKRGRPPKTNPKTLPGLFDSESDE